MSYYYGSPPPPPMASAGYYQQSLYGAAPPPMIPPPQPQQQQQQPYPRAHTHYGYGPMPGGMPPSSSGAGYYGQPVAMPQAPPPRMPSAPPQQPTPQSSNMNDPNIFRIYFRSGLQALTYNSRQIIQDLTMLANDFALRMSSIVGEEIDGHIRTAPPTMKLPALYLMDSIAKNVGHPYITIFSRYMERLFLQAYRDVEPPVKIKMEELLGTWRTGGPNGTMLYPERLQRNLEDALFGRGGRGGGIGALGKGITDAAHYAAGVQQRPTVAPPQEVAALLHEIRRVLGVRQARAYREPSDQSNMLSVEALQKLEVIVSSTGVSNEQAHQIRQQLTTLSPQEEPLIASTSAAGDMYSSLSGMDPASLSKLLAGQQPAGGSTPNHPFAGALQNLDSNLLANLSAAMGVGSTYTRDSAEIAYEEKLFAGFARETDQVGLTPATINRPQSACHELIYDDMPLQCTQCAARWIDTARHKKVLQKHMDRHFRINNRLSGALRTQSRSWLTLEEDWLSEPAAEVEDQEKHEEAEIAAEVARSFVKVPTDPIRASKPCPICKEKFKQQWAEQEEDFVWSDAKNVDGVIYHASCYLETRKARNYSKKTKVEGGTPSLTSSVPPSREATPQLPASHSPSKAKAANGSPKSGLAQSVKAEEAVDQGLPPASSSPPATENAETAVEHPALASVLSAVAKSGSTDAAEGNNAAPEAPASAPEQNHPQTGAAPLALDPGVLQALADIVSRGNTPLNIADTSEPQGLKRTADALEAPAAGSIPDTPESVKRVKQESDVNDGVEPSNS